MPRRRLAVDRLSGQARGLWRARGGPGFKGDRGSDGRSAVAIDVDGEGLLTIVNGDGEEVTCDLYPLLLKLAQR